MSTHLACGDRSTRLRWFAILACLGALVTGHSAGAEVHAEPRFGGEIRVAIRSDLPGTIPGVNRSSTSDDVLHHVVEALVAYRDDLTVAPLLASSVDVSQDMTSYTFHLRPDVTFHNGAPMTSREVRWSWQWFMNPKNNWLCRGWYDGSQGLKVTSVETPDSRTVTFRLAQPNALFLQRLANVQCITAVLHPDSLDATGQWRAPVGTGPYKLKEWKRGQYVLLERHTGYKPAEGVRSGLAGARIPYADRIRWMVIPESSSANAALMAGQVDLVYSLSAMDATDLERARNVTLYRAPSLERNMLLIQSNTPALADIRVRQAIAHAIDYEKLARAVTFGLVGANPSVIAQSSPYYSPAQRQGYSYDPALSRQLLAQVGQRPTLKLQANKRFQHMYDSALIVQSMLKRIGIEVQLEVLEWTTQLANYYAGKFELMAFSFSGRMDPVFEFETILGDRATYPFLQWGDAQAQTLMSKASVISDCRQRQQLFDAAHRRMIEQVPALNLGNLYVIDAASRKLHGYAPWPVAKPRLWGVWLER